MTQSKDSSGDDDPSLPVGCTDIRSSRTQRLPPGAMFQDWKIFLSTSASRTWSTAGSFLDSTSAGF